MEHTVTTLNRPDQELDIKLRPSRFADFTVKKGVKERGQKERRKGSVL